MGIRKDKLEEVPFLDAGLEHAQHPILCSYRYLDSLLRMRNSYSRLSGLGSTLGRARREGECGGQRPRSVRDARLAAYVWVRRE